MQQRGRGGYEFFPEDGNYVFTMTQWYPRLCVYSDFKGWQNQQFTGRGEFALTFGNFKVAMTVPADHVIMSTGEGQNYAAVLTPAQLARGNKAQVSSEPVEVVTLDEAKAAEKHPIQSPSVPRITNRLILFLLEFYSAIESAVLLRHHERSSRDHM